MGRIWFFVQEAFRALRRNAAPSIAAIVTTIVTVLLLGMLIPALFFTQSTSEGVRDQLALNVFFHLDATEEEVAQVRAEVAQIPHVQSIEFVSRAEALKILEQRLEDPDILKELNSNPLPASFRIHPDDAANMDAIRQAVEPVGPDGRPQPISPVIQDVEDSREQAQPIERVTGALKIILGVMALLLGVASVMLVANTIRLSIYARRREVEVMRLVGATRWFIRWPFMIEGVLVGFAGAAVAILLLWLGKLIVVDPLADSFELVRAQTETDVSFTVLVLVLLGAATLVSAIGSGITLRRFLKV